MEIKFTLQGVLIYAAMAGYGVAFVLSIFRRGRWGEAAFLAGFVVAAFAFCYRWVNVGHVPMQNLFEVFLTMGMLMYPLSLFCRRYMRVAGGKVDMLIGVIVLVPAGFVFSAEPRQLPPALQCGLFGPHVAVYVISYVLMAKATVQALGRLFVKLPGSAGRGEEPSDCKGSLVDYEQGTYRMICIGFPLMTLGLVLGSWWGHLAWGDYWGWDPKELWSLTTWLVYLGYFHFRYMFGVKYARINSVLAIAGMACVLITLLWVNLAKLFAGLHSYA